MSAGFLPSPPAPSGYQNHQDSPPVPLDLGDSEVRFASSGFKVPSVQRNTEDIPAGDMGRHLGKEAERSMGSLDKRCDTSYSAHTEEVSSFIYFFKSLRYKKPKLGFKCGRMPTPVSVHCFLSTLNFFG